MMRIIKNTSPYDTRALRSLICKVHNHMRKLEGRKAPRWDVLDIQAGRSKRGKDSTSGYAFYGGAGYVDGWDVFLGLPHEGATERRVARLVYHELMHTYGYRHGQYAEIPHGELVELFPENNPLPLKAEKPKDETPIWVKRYAALLKREKAWLTKQKRARNALKKIKQQRRYYERKYPELTA